MTNPKTLHLTINEALAAEFPVFAVQPITIEAEESVSIDEYITVDVTESANVDIDYSIGVEETMNVDNPAVNVDKTGHKHVTIELEETDINGV